MSAPNSDSQLIEFLLKPGNFDVALAVYDFERLCGERTKPASELRLNEHR